jgi:nucleotide-binding universal stress UspA family protein
MTPISGLKNILIALTEEGSSEPSAALGYAMSLARKADAHVTVNAASVGLDIPHAHGSSMAARLVAMENRRVHEVTERVAEKARGDATMAGVICETETPQLRYSELRDRLLAEARVNDVTVLDADISVLTVDGGILRTIVFESGRPTIVIPKGADVFACTKIIIAWDGSAAASRAVGAAMPFLRAAQAVEIVCYVDDKDLSTSAAGVDLAAYLARHGVEVSVNELPSGGDVADRLREHAGFYHADLIVMGAFVHSPLREWLFGGVTQAMLTSPPAPLLVAR